MALRNNARNSDAFVNVIEAQQKLHSRNFHHLTHKLGIRTDLYAHDINVTAISCWRSISSWAIIIGSQKSCLAIHFTGEWAKSLFDNTKGDVLARRLWVFGNGRGRILCRRRAVRFHCSGMQDESIKKDNEVSRMFRTLSDIFGTSRARFKQGFLENNL